MNELEIYGYKKVSVKINEKLYQRVVVRLALNWSMARRLGREQISERSS